MHCKSGGKKHGNKQIHIIQIIAKTKYKNLKWKHNKSKCVFTNTTPILYESFIQSQFAY